MLKSKITVDLPSAETRRSMGPVEWVRSLFGAAIDLRSGKEELTVGAMSLVEGLVEGFSRAGVSNAISLLVDKKVVYLDTNDVPDDLSLIGKAAEDTGTLDRPFKEMHLVLTHKEAGLHVILDTRIQSKVLLGAAEMECVLSARVEDLQIRAGETAQAYADRVRAFTKDDKAMEPFRAALDALTARVEGALRAALVGAKVASERAEVEIIRPNTQQIARFRQLGFGDDVRQPAYRPVPTMQRYGAYADPFFYYYYDPYYDFMNWVMLDTMLTAGSWNNPSVVVVEPGGQQLFTGSDVSGGMATGWTGADAVSFDSSGGVAVDPSIPDAPATGGGDVPADLAATGGDSGWADAGTSVGGDSSSSCGSSGSGSSCGSSSSSSCSSGSSSCSSSSCSSGSSCGSSCGGSSCGSSCGSN